MRGKSRLIEPRFPGDRGQDGRVGDIAIAAIKGTMEAIEQVERRVRRLPARQHGRTAGGFGVVDKAVPLEESIIEDLAGGLMDMVPMLPRAGFGGGIHRGSGAGAQAAEDEADL